MRSFQDRLIVLVLLFRRQTVRVLKNELVRRTLGERVQMMNAIDDDDIR